MSKVILISSEVLISKSLIKQYNKSNPKILFIKTAANAQDGDLTWLDNACNAMEDAGFELVMYELENKCHEDFIVDIDNSFDGIHFSGGVPDYLLFHIKMSEFDKFLNEKKDQLIISGASAGAMVLGKSIKSSLSWASKKVKLDSYNGLKYVNFEVMPYFQEGEYLKNILTCLKESAKDGNNVINLNDHSYIVQENDNIKIIDIREE